MSGDLSSYMLKVAKGDKDSFRFIANSLGYKMHATAIKILGATFFGCNFLLVETYCYN